MSRNRIDCNCNNSQHYHWKSGRQFLLQALNGGLFSVDDVSEVVLFLSGLIQYPAIPVSAQQSISGSHSEAQHASNIDEMEVQRLAFVVVGSLMSQSRSLVSGEAWTSAVQVRNFNVSY